MANFNENEISECLKFINSNPTTAAGIAINLGVTPDKAKTLLLAILSRYKGEIFLDKSSGETTFKFIFPLSKRRNKSLKEIILGAVSIIYNTLIGFLKSILAILVLALYFIYQVIPMVFVGFGSKNKEIKKEAFSPLKMFIITIKSLFVSIINYSGDKPIIWVKTKKGRYYRKYISQKLPNSEPSLFFSGEKNLVDLVFDFVFGPKRAVYRKSDHLKRALLLASQNEGKIRLYDLIELEGYTLETAKQKLVEYASAMGGDVDFNDKGDVFAYLPEFDIQETQDISFLVKYYEEEEPPYLLTGNAPGEIYMLLFFMVAPIAITGSYLLKKIKVNRGFEEYILAIVYFTLFVFLAPLVRYPFVKIANLFLNHSNKRRKVLKTLFNNIIDFQIYESDIKVAGVSKDFIIKILNEYEAKADFDESGSVYYTLGK